MDVGWSIGDVLPEAICKFTHSDLRKVGQTLPRSSFYYSSYHRSRSNLANVPNSPGEKLRHIIDNLGKRSGVAQGLGRAITTFDLLNYSDGHTIYILRSDPENEQEKILGFLKIGSKPLFVMDVHGHQHEVKPLCVLDFYVVEEMQRKGCGKKLFEFMTHDQNVKPQQLAIDRPSAKFKGFLRKHYRLAHTIPQANNFCIFDGFFRYYKTRRNRNSLTDGFHERRKYERYSKSSHARLLDREKLPQIENHVRSAPLPDPISINRNHVRKEPVRERQFSTLPPNSGQSGQISNSNVPKILNEEYSAYASQWQPKSNLRNYQRHSSAFRIFGNLDTR